MTCHRCLCCQQHIDSLEPMNHADHTKALFPGCQLHLTFKFCRYKCRHKHCPLNTMSIGNNTKCKQNALETVPAGNNIHWHLCPNCGSVHRCCWIPIWKVGLDVAGNDAEAEDCFARSLELVDAVRGRDHAEAVFSLGAYAAFLKSVPPPCLQSIYQSLHQSLTQSLTCSLVMPGKT